MKECPICKAQCFSDMTVCFGCMHIFEEKKEVNFEQNPHKQETISLPALNSNSAKTNISQEPLTIPLVQKNISGKESRAKHHDGIVKEKETLQVEYQLTITLKPVATA